MNNLTMKNRELKHKPVLGGAASDSMLVVDLLSCKLQRLIKFEGFRYLDIGCGNGAFTIKLGKGFREVYGIDLNHDSVDLFKKKIKSRAMSNFEVSDMSIEKMDFPNDYFDVVTAIEVLEHVENFEIGLSEIARVIKPNGFLGITCPNRLFPFETHGIMWNGKEIAGRIPLIPYIPFLHNKYALARVFTVAELDCKLKKIGFHRTGLDFAFPTLERGNKLGMIMRPFRRCFRVLEKTLLKIFGVSIIAAYQMTNKKLT